MESLNLYNEKEKSRSIMKSLKRMQSKRNIINGTIYTSLIIAAIYTLFPLIFLFINSFKGQAEIVGSPLSVPKSWDLSYLGNALEQIHLFRSVGYTLLITVSSVTLIVIISLFTAWVMVRSKSKFSNILFLAFTAAMLIPFQSVMYPLISFMEKLHLKNIGGLILMYGGFGLSLSVFLYHGFLKSIPVSLEEAAVIDGANIFQVFFKVIFPLVKPTTVTVIIVNAVWIWNDYLLPFLVLGNSQKKTLMLELYYAKNLAGQYGNPWELLFPSVLIVIIPIVLLFLFLQKYIVAGVTDGAEKG
ncbi:sugar ABC transporter permease [Clostridium polyendosporum]|uniref:Sugar ABC transporter permease n=2 Tax=Clostridium polyendosporum TaxID=69208 RepID=A0A919VG59_9CLOT|nr:sugar ABC transporter permease [Clostridium polyendosporum]